MPIILWIVAKTGLPKWLVAVIGGILALIACWGLVKLVVHYHDKGVIAAHENKVEAQLHNQAVTADNTLEQRKEADEAAIVLNRQEFNNATANIPRTGLSARQRVDGCRELRNQGTDKAILARAGCL